MSALDRLAERMFGRQRLETTAAMASVDTQTYIGVATSDSADGSVSVVLSDDVTQPDNGIWDGETFLASDELGTSVELPTTTAVREGDRVLVTASGANVMATPVVTGVVGRGDEQQAQIDAAAEGVESVAAIAQEASAEVEQVRQDVADFRDDVATTYATKVERQDGDDAVKTWVTTNYTNSNDLATTYATKTLVSQTKDAIELAASQTYETQSDAAATYATKSALTVGLNGIRTEVAEDYQPKGDYATTASMNSAIQQSASSIESSVAATYETKTDASTTYATKTEVQQTAAGLDTRITTAQSTADGAYLERTATGTTIDTTGAATIRSLVVEGQSAQDGTPTPSAPVPIVSVESRNLLPVYSATTVNGITFTVDGSGAVTANGTASATVNHYVLFTVPETGAYVVSGCPAGGSASTYQLWTYDTTTPRDQQLTDTGSGATGTFTKGHRISVRIRFQSGYTATDLTFRPMLERGSTVHDYQPYGCVTLVAQSRNLLDMAKTDSTLPRTHNGITFSDNGDGGIRVSGTATAWAYFQFASQANNNFLEAGETYTLGGITTPGVLFNAWKTGGSDIDSDAAVTMQVPSSGSWNFKIRVLTGTTVNGVVYPQIERGTAATAYTPYVNSRTDIDLQGHALRSLPDGTHDEMTVDSLGRVTMTQRVGAFVADSTTPYVASVALNGTTTMRANFRVPDFDGIASNNVVSDLFVRDADHQAAWGNVSFGEVFSTSAGFFFGLPTTVTDASSANAWFASNPTTVLYPLATPQTIDLGTIDLPAPADTLWLDAALVPTIGATWWTVGGIAGQQALDAEVTERQTLIRQFSGGVLAGYVGNAVAALVNAAGSFDVVSTTWTDGVPTVTDTLARYAANLVELGRNSTTSVIEFCGGIADLAYRGTSAILRSKTGSVGIQSGTLDLYSSTQAALIASTLATVNDGSVQIQLGSAKPRLYAIADSVYLADTSDPYTLNKEVDMYSLIKATNCRSEGVVTLWVGTKVMNVGTNVSSFTLFTKAQLQAIVGTDWTPTGANCAVFVMNGDYGATDAMMSASINSSSVVRVHMNKTKTGDTRINYLIVRIGG